MQIFSANLPRSFSCERNIRQKTLGSQTCGMQWFPTCCFSMTSPWSPSNIGGLHEPPHLHLFWRPGRILGEVVSEDVMMPLEEVSGGKMNGKKKGNNHPFVRSLMPTTNRINSPWKRVSKNRFGWVFCGSFLAARKKATFHQKLPTIGDWYEEFFVRWCGMFFWTAIN